MGMPEPKIGERKYYVPPTPVPPLHYTIFPLVCQAPVVAGKQQPNSA